MTTMLWKSIILLFVYQVYADDSRFSGTYAKARKWCKHHCDNSKPVGSPVVFNNACTCITQGSEVKHDSFQTLQAEWKAVQEKCKADFTDPDERIECEQVKNFPIFQEFIHLMEKNGITDIPNDKAPQGRMNWKSYKKIKSQEEFVKTLKSNTHSTIFGTWIACCLLLLNILID